jgi:hypothetical protein
VARAIDELSCVCDVADAIRLVEDNVIDQNATIVNTINTLLDLVHSLPLSVPDTHKKALHSLADHCTFSREIATFFSTSGVSRMDVTHAFYWCIGAVVANSFFVEDLN